MAKLVGNVTVVVILVIVVGFIIYGCRHGWFTGSGSAGFFEMEAMGSFFQGLGELASMFQGGGSAAAGGGAQAIVKSAVSDAVGRGMANLSAVRTIAGGAMVGGGRAGAYAGYASLLVLVTVMSIVPRPKRCQPRVNMSSPPAYKLANKDCKLADISA